MAWCSECWEPVCCSSECPTNEMVASLFLGCSLNSITHQKPREKRPLIAKDHKLLANINVQAEKAMAPHSSTLAWKIPWTEDPGGLQSMGSRRVGHDWATSLSLFTFMQWRRKCNRLQSSCLENPRDRGAWWAAIYKVAQSRTRLKQLSSNSSRQR